MRVSPASQSNTACTPQPRGRSCTPSLGTSRQISTRPSSALAAVAGSAVLITGVSGSDDAVALVAAITFVTGILFLLLALLRMGWISQFLSKAVITGFLFGAAIEVVIGELPKITGTSAEGTNAWQELFSWLRSLPDTDGATLLVGLISLGVIFGLRRVAPRVPGALVLVVGGLVASAVFGLGERGLALVGDVPSGLPSLALPDLQFVLENLPVIGAASIGLLLIGFSQSAGTARLCRQAQVSGRYQSGISRPGHLQLGFRSGAGYSRFHQPVGQFAQ